MDFVILAIDLFILSVIVSSPFIWRYFTKKRAVKLNEKTRQAMREAEAIQFIKT
ncbi:MAG: hypothetical protein ACFFB3_11145 [Candidatus Hodarchaeota archaeon]